MYLYKWKRRETDAEAQTSATYFYAYRVFHKVFENFKIESLTIANISMKLVHASQVTDKFCIE